MRGKLYVAFWIFYLLVPLFIDVFFAPYQLLAYRWLPNEAFQESKHEMLASHVACNDDDCRPVADVWRDKGSGQVFSRRSFEQHRLSEATRMGWTWFSYGLIGCVALAFYSYTTHYDKTRAYSVFGWSCL